MKTNALMVCKALLSGRPKEMQERLFPLFSEKDQVALNKIQPKVPLSKEALKWDLLNHIHYSWLAPYLRTLAEGDIRLFLASLSSEQMKGLEKALGFT